MSYKLYAVRIFSFQWEASLAFYRDVLGLPLHFSDENLGWAQFDLQGSYIGLERCDPDDPEVRALVGRFVGISIQIDDIHATYDSLRAKGVKFTGPPEKQPWGGSLAHFADPDGNVLTLLGG